MKTLKILLTVTGMGLMSQAQTASTVKDTSEVFVQTGHGMSTTATAFSPDGKRLISCDGSGQLIAWDSESGLQFRSLYRHLGMCLNVAFTAGGDRVFSTGGARSGQDLTETDYKTGRVLNTWTGHTGLIVGVAVLANGVWTLGESDGLKFWEAGKAQPTRTVNVPEAQWGAATQLAQQAADGALWVGTRQGKVLRVQSDGTVQPLAQFGESISALAASPDGVSVAVSFGEYRGSKNRSIVVLNARTGQTLRELKGHVGSPVSLSFSADSTVLASLAQMDLQTLLSGGIRDLEGHEEVRIWSVETGALLSSARNKRNLFGTPFLRAQVQFSANGRQLAIAAWDEAIRTYRLGDQNTLEPYKVLEGRGVPALHISVDANGRQLAVSNGRPRVKAPTQYMTAEQIMRDMGGPGRFTPAQQERLGLLYSPKGFSKEVQTVSVWDLKEGQLRNAYDWQLGPTQWMGSPTSANGFVSLAPLFPHTVTVSPLKNRLIRQATLNESGVLSLGHFSYEANQGTPDEVTDTQVLSNDPAYSAHAMALSNNGKLTAIATSKIHSDAAQRDHKIHILRMDQVQHELVGQWPLPGQAMALAFSPDGRVLWASCSVNAPQFSQKHQGAVWALDTRDGKVLGQWTLPEGVTAAQIAPHASGRTLAISGDSRLHLLTIGDKVPRAQVIWKGADRPVTALSATADGTELALSNTAGQAARLDWRQTNRPVVKWATRLVEPFPHLWSWSADKNTLVAASDDGRMRLVNPSNGQVRLNLFQFDNQQWLAISKEGYFAASAQGDDWVNVRVNDAVYRIGQFYDVFYRPDIVQRSLQGLPIADLISVTLDDALQRPPPKVTLQKNSEAPYSNAQIKVQIDNAGGGIGEVRLLLNGKLLARKNTAIEQLVAAPAPSAVVTQSPLSTAALTPGKAATPLRALRLANQQQLEKTRVSQTQTALTIEQSIEVPPGENEIAVMALNAAGDLSSRPTRLPLINPAAPKPPTLWVLSVGINQFKAQSTAPTLNFAVKDAKNFSSAVVAPLSTALGASRTEVIELLDEQATRQGLSLALDRIAREAGPQDVFVWFVASHGTLDDLAQYGLVLQDWNGSTAPGSLFSSEEVLKASTRIAAFRQLVILDTCHAGGLTGWLRGLYDARFSVLARNSGLHLFASASETQQAMDGYQGNGLYTHVLLKAANDAAADVNQDGQVDTGEWGVFAKRETMRLAKLLRHQQEPMMMNFGKEIPVYVFR